MDFKCSSLLPGHLEIRLDQRFSSEGGSWFCPPPPSEGPCGRSGGSSDCLNYWPLVGGGQKCTGPPSLWWGLSATAHPMSLVLKLRNSGLEGQKVTSPQDTLPKCRRTLKSPPTSFCLQSVALMKCREMIIWILESGFLVLKLCSAFQ